MPAMDGALIANGGQFGATPSSYIANVADGGQQGFGPLLLNLDANTPPVFMPLKIIVTHAPTFLEYIPNGPEIFKSLMETNLITMDGLQFAYTMEIEGTPVGRDGQLQNVPTRQTRSQISPVCTWPEKIGNVVFNLGKLWMNAMRDIDTQASSMAGIIPEGYSLPPLVSSMYSADIMCIQYDSTMRPENIIDAFALTNFFPTEIGSPDYRMSVLENHRPERSFTFTCIVQHNNNTVVAAKNLARLMNLHAINYQDADPIATEIEQNIAGDGLIYQTSQYFDEFQNLNGVVGGA